MSERDRLDADAIRQNLSTKLVGRDIVVFDSTTSSNDIAWQCARNRNNNGLTIFVEEQTAGRGRAGTKWLSGKFESILCSILLLDCKISAELITLTAAVATSEAIGRCGSSEAKIKWPNDIIINGKKVAGILVESKSVKSQTSYVIGIGINCHQKNEAFGPDLRKTATSLDIETKTIADRISLARRLLISLDDWLVTAAKSNQKVVDRWCQLSTQLSHRVTLSYNNQLFSGNCIGLDPGRGLILQLDRGGLRMFDAAHSSVVNSI